MTIVEPKLGKLCILKLKYVNENIVMDDWNLDEESLDKQHVIATLKTYYAQEKFTRNDK